MAGDTAPVRQCTSDRPLLQARMTRAHKDAPWIEDIASTSGVFDLTGHQDAGTVESDTWGRNARCRASRYGAVAMATKYICRRMFDASGAACSSNRLALRYDLNMALLTNRDKRFKTYSEEMGANQNAVCRH